MTWDEQSVAARVRAFLAEHDPAAPHDMELWKTLARDIGVAGLLVPEDLGGAGASAREAAVVLEELGRTVAPVPFLTSSVLATEALLAARTATGAASGAVGESREAAEELLGRLAAGEIVAALAVPYATSPHRTGGTGGGGARRRGGPPVARRHRHDLGAPGAPLPQARQGR